MKLYLLYYSLKLKIDLLNILSATLLLNCLWKTHLLIMVYCQVDNRVSGVLLRGRFAVNIIKVSISLKIIKGI